MHDENIQKEKLIPVEEHLQFLGYQTEMEKVWNMLLLNALASAPNLPNLVITYSFNMYAVGAKYLCHEENDLHSLYEQLNDVNNNEFFVKIAYLNKADLLLMQWFFNVYEREDFAQFIQRFFFEVWDALRRLEKFLQ